MSSYAFWNNKGGVGKSFLTFVTSCEYARNNPDTNVFVIDLCPQANVSETLLGGQENGGIALRKILGGKERLSVGGYIESRLNSPFLQVENSQKYSVQVSKWNEKIPENLFLICGDNLVEILSEAIRQTSQLVVPLDSWKKVMYWIKDLKDSLRESKQNESIFFIDCNPSFAIYTQLAITAADYLVIPFTADESSRRGMENIIALLYGQGDSYIANFARLSFYKQAKEHGIDLPKLHTFISNRVMTFDGEQSKAFKAANSSIKDTVRLLSRKHKTIFASPQVESDDRFVEIPDYHSASIVSALTGTPMHKMKAGPKKINGERIQINPGPLASYKLALTKLVNRF